MKRLLRAAPMLLVMMASVAVNVEAAVLAHKVIPKRAYRTNGSNDPAFQPTTGTAGYIDSTTWNFNVTGASTTAMQCTTATFTINNWQLIPSQPGNTVTAVDTLLGIEVTLAPSTKLGNTPAFDTLTATLQGSWDGGTNWISGATRRTLEVGTSNVSQSMWNTIWSIPLPATPATNNTTILHCPLLRFILGGGGTYGGTDSGGFELNVRYWQSDQYGGVPIPVGSR